MSSNLKGLVISGPTGVGKTDMSIKLANHLIVRLFQQILHKFIDTWI